MLSTFQTLPHYQVHRHPCNEVSPPWSAVYTSNSSSFTDLPINEVSPPLECCVHAHSTVSRFVGDLAARIGGGVLFELSDCKRDSACARVNHLTFSLSFMQRHPYPYWERCNTLQNSAKHCNTLQPYAFINTFSLTHRHPFPYWERCNRLILTADFPY